MKMKLMNIKFGIVRISILFLLAILSACGNDGSTPEQPAAAITAQPTDQSVLAGTTATFDVVAGNATGYQWQISSDGGATFANVIGATAASYTTAVTTLADSGTRYRVIVSGIVNSVTSSAVTLTVTAAPVAPGITVHPANQIITEGQNANFSVTATGTTLGYQWQRSSDDGASFADIADATNATLTLTAAPLAVNAHQFRVVVSNSVASVPSNAALLTVNAAQSAPAFTTQPVSVSIAAGQNTAFTVAVSGTPTPTLQWQLSTDSGANWSDISGETDTTFNVIAPALANNGRQFRAVASNSAGTVNSNAATLTVNAGAVAPAFTTHPADVTISEGQSAQLTVVVTGTPTPTLQWQLSTDGGSNWSNINGETGTSFNVIAPSLANNGRQFRVVASNSEGTVNSNPATLTVNAVSSTNAILVSATPSLIVSNSPSHTPSISADGRWVAFATDSEAATNLVADGFGGGAFLHDMSTRTTTRINVQPDGGYSSQFVSHLKVAADGQYALFSSYANDLVAGDTNGALDIFVRNLQTGVTTRENVLADGSQDNVSGNAGHPFAPDISADGRWVLMWSSVNLAGAGDYVGSGLFLRDRSTGVTRSVVPLGTGLFGAALSASGQYVMSVSASGSGASYTYHLDVYNVALSTTIRLLSVPSDNGLGAMHGVVSVSDDGRFVACSLRSPTLVGGAAATNYQTVVLDRNLADPVAGMELVSVTDAGVAGSAGSSTRPQLSGDGRYVLFASRATNLAVEQFSDTLLVRDRQAGTTQVASRRIDGTPASGGSGMGSEALTRDGAFVVFMGDMLKIVDPAGNSGSGTQIFRVGRSGPAAVNTTAPTATLNAASIANNGSAIVQSSEMGTAYLVRNTIAVTTLADITGAAVNLWNSTAIASANSDTSLSVAGLDAGVYKLYTVDAADNLSSVASNTVVVTNTNDANRIDLTDASVIGDEGNLIAPVYVDGNWYFHWDRSGDGTSTDTGSLNGGRDYINQIVLDGIFGSSAALPPNRYATFNGVQLALPTHGDVTLTTGFRPGTAIDNSPNGEANPTYDDLLAIWDGYNGTGTGTNINGTPPGWQTYDYWSADRRNVVLALGYVYVSVDTPYNYVALQVL